LKSLCYDERSEKHQNISVCPQTLGFRGTAQQIVDLITLAPSCGGTYTFYQCI